jgi:DNA-binding response OmpR family regulator
MAKLLVVEDNSTMAQALTNDLVAEGHIVETADNGEAGLKRALEHNFDLILLDVLLPKMDGYKVCKALRNHKIVTPIIMVTGQGGESDKVLGLDCGADDYVTKPFGSFELAARVRALLRRTAKDDEVLRFGDMEIDFGRAEVRRLGSPIELTPLEFKLLAVFVKRKGHILTRTQLLDEVWGHSRYPNDRVIDQHIMNLRRKIGIDYFKNIRGMGYRFDA